MLELLLVLVIVAVIVGAVAAGSGVVQSLAVSTSADMISDGLTEARSDAVAQNMTVEVRFYQLAPSGGGAAVYQAMQLHWLKPDRTTPAVAGPILLSSWTVIDATAGHSPLIANGQVAKADASDWRMNGGTRVFHFLPDGSTDLSPVTNWFLTLRAANQSDPTHFPANWASVGIDATTGRVRVYRP